jgi:tetratricopeptide (TPR) repeat protein
MRRCSMRVLLGTFAAIVVARSGAGAQERDSISAVRVARISAVLDSGRYDEAEALARRFVTQPNGREGYGVLGAVLQARGRYAAAESAWTRAVELRATDSLTAAVRLAQLHFDRGERDRAMREFDRFIDIYNTRASRLTSEELAAVGLACRYLGLENPQLFKDALRAFDRALARDPGNLQARIALGELFLEKYNDVDAQKTFAEVLDRDSTSVDGLLGEARRRIADSQPGVDSLLVRASRVNPNAVGTRVIRARTLMDLEQYGDAQREIDRAFAVNPNASDALATAAAIKYLTGDRPGYEALRQRALALNPRDAGFYATMAELASRVRLYETAAEFARQGVAVEPKDWGAHAQLGMNLLRLGRIDEGRRALGTAFAGDPYDVRVKNTLDLLDTFSNYDTRSYGPVQLMVEKSEADLMGLYIGDLAAKAYATFSERYGYTPTPPVRIEVYRSHADFSVRTVGLAGLGALGVSFGSTLAFDSPAAKDAGPFNWGSTVWHELAHTFTLGLTDHRVPRWLSEGLSVYEEHRAKPGWGFDVSPEFLDAYRKGKLVPVSRMNDGFMRPAYPEQVQYSYYQASLVCDLIARDGGDRAILAMLQGYKAGKTTDEIFRTVLNIDPRAFDKKFDDYMRERFGARIAALDSVQAGLRSAGESLQRRDTTAAIAALERVRALFPGFAGEESASLALARLYAAKGDRARTADALAEIVQHNESSLEAHVRLIPVLLALGDTTRAIEMLDRSMYINPYDMPRHEQLAVLARRTGARSIAVRERRAIVALDPADRAEAYYQLALAEFEVGDRSGARRSVLTALEEAPGFVPAQELLLKIVDGGTP